MLFTIVAALSGGIPLRYGRFKNQPEAEDYLRRCGWVQLLRLRGNLTDIPDNLMLGHEGETQFWGYNETKDVHGRQRYICYAIVESVQKIIEATLDFHAKEDLPSASDR